MLVSTEIKDRIAYIKMQNGKHFNCLSEEMCLELIEAIKKSYSLQCVGIVIKAEVNRNVWSAGHDIKELPVDGSDPLAFNVPMEELLREVQDVPIPVIACVDGTVWGGACDLCLS
ncbi:MAG: enoyl-CoA hydratase/isomerase family protein, partial [Anaerovibrio sp.]|uniref:enoyl-CoA hydratase-related protein n=1 Tax=Anaerovibrio sp. TaxID=1872532 RepID=UPI001B0FC35D